MSTIQTSSYRRQRDHFEPQDTDPQEQRRLRGLLEQIDYSTYVANREVIGQMLPRLDAAQRRAPNGWPRACASRNPARARRRTRSRA